MKIFRPLAAALLVFALGHVAPAQESSEIASLRTKAAKGNGIAQYNLGLAYAQGRGVAADPVEAFVWLSLARDNGARGRALDTVIGALDKPALELAQQRLTERKAALTGRPASPAPARPETPAEVSGRETPVNPAGPAPASTGEDPAVATLRAERDALAVRINNLAGDLAELRAERERLAKLATDNERAAQTATEVGRAAEARIAGLVRAGEAVQAELAQARSALASLQQAPKPAPDTAALEAKTHELAAALAELEAAKNFGRQVEDTLNKVNDDRARVAANATAELEAARQFGQQVEATLNRVNDQKAALETQLATVQRALAAKPGYPDLSGRVAELESALAAKPAAPTYPDLSGRVNELEAALVTARNATPAYPNLTDRVRELEAQRSSDLSAVASAQAEAGRTQQEIAALTRAKEAAHRELADTNNSLARANQALTAKPAAPAYPDLSGRVAELEAALAAARDTAPAYPDLRSNVATLEEQLGAAKLALAARPAVPAYPDLSGRVGELEAALTAARTAAPAYPNLSGKVSELEGQLASLQSTAAATARLETRLAEREKQVLQLAQEVKRGETGMKQAQESYTALEAEANQLRQRPVAPAYPDLSGRVKELEAALATARNAAPAYPDLSGRVGELETALADASRQLVATQNAKPAAPAYPDLSGRVAELEAAVAASLQKFGTAEQARAEVSRQFDDYKSATAAAQRERTTLQSNLKMLESDKAALRRQVDAATTEANQLRTQVATLKTQAVAPKNTAPAYPDLSGRVAELETALAARPAAPAYPDLSGRVNELEAALVTAHNATPAYPNLADKVAELETKLAGAEKSAAALSAEAANARQQVAVLTKAQEERPAPPAYPDLSGQVAELSNEITQLRADRERMQKLLADSGRQLAEATAANRSRPVAPPGYLDRVRELETALAASRQQQAALQTAPVAPAYPDLSGRVAELEAKLAAAEKPAVEKPAVPAYPDLSGRVSDLTGEVAQLRADRERMQKLLADSGRQLRDNTADTARIRELETQLAAAQTQVGGITTERNAARDAQSELRDTIARLEQEKTQLAAAPNSAPAYPDLSVRVHELEAQLATAPRNQALPAYPDLSGRVGELESALAATKQQLAAAQTAPATAGGGDTPDLAQKLADTEDRLATALRGYAALQRERDTLAENTGKTAAAVTAERDALAGQVASLTGQVEQLRASAQSSTASAQAELARLNEAVATLQRTSTQASRDAATARTLAQQLQGANAVLAGENYQLKTMLARSTGGPAPAIAPVTAPAVRTHVVAAGDSLSRLSQRYYGTAGRWQEIYTANAALLGPNGVLRVGTELRIP